MKKIIYIPFLAISLIFSGCSDDFLEHKDLYSFSDANYYSKPEEVNTALAAAYSQLVTDGGNNDPIFLANLMSDDCFGGGGPDNVDFQNTDGFRNSIEDQYLEIWYTSYAGILRANMVIERIDGANYTSEADKNQALGEALFLRAFYHLRLTQLFGNVPLKASSTSTSDINTPAEDIFAQIASDLKQAIEIMPNTTNLPNGHATKWAAEGIMARAFLFYTGFYNKSELPLVDGGVVTKAQVNTWLVDCIENSGHRLVSDFRNLWPYASTSTELGEFQYPYAINNNLVWEGDGNIETVFAAKFSIYGSHNAENPDNSSDVSRYWSILSYSNQLVLYSAMRALQETSNDIFPFGMGWGGGQVNPQLFASFDDADIRKQGSIVDVTDPNEGNINALFEYGKWECQQETGFGQKKYTPIYAETETGYFGMYYKLYGTPSDYQLWNMQDEIFLRFSDILLMAAELEAPGAQGYYDAVRTRAGLPSRPATLENIKEERRHELAFEGLRYFDLLRWHDAEAAFAAVKDVTVYNAGIAGTYSSSYRQDRCFLPIPESQVRLSNGSMEQNAGWK